MTDFINYSVDLSNLRFLTPEDREVIKRYIVTPDDVYISIAGTTGLVGIVPDQLNGANLTENAARLVILDRCVADKWFLAFFLSSPVGATAIAERTTKTSQPKLALARIKEIPISLPPLSEQRAIAHVLRAVQRAKEATEAVIAAARQVRHSLMGYLFAAGAVELSDRCKLELRETSIGQIPAHWTDAPLGTFITLQRGFDLPAHSRVEGGVPVVSSSGVSGFHSEAKVKGPGVVTGRYGTLGTVHYIEQDFWPLNTTLFVKEYRHCDARFISYLLQTLNLGQFNDKTSVPGVNRNHVHAMYVAMPPVEEQGRIIPILNCIDQKISREESYCMALGTLFASLLHNLMNGKVRVNDLQFADAAGGA